MEIEIGVIENNGPFRLDVQKHLIDRGLAILGIRGSGKSYLSGKICEELCKINQPFIVIDIMGEYYTLKEKFPVVVIAQGSPDYADIKNITSEMAPAIAKVCLKVHQPVVLDLGAGSMLEKYKFLAKFLEAFYEEAKSRKKMVPIILVMDEAHRLLPEKSIIRLREVREFQDKVMYYTYEIAATGRHFGLGFICVARRAAEISKSILTQTELKFFFKVTDIDLDRLREEASKEIVEKVKSFEPGTAVVTGLPEPVIIHVYERECTHGGGTPLAKPVTVPEIDQFKQTLQKVLEEIKTPPTVPKVPKTIIKELKEKTKRISELETLVTSLKTEISKLRSENEMLRNQIYLLEENMKKLVSPDEVESLKLKIATLEEENSTLKSRIKDLEEQLSEASKLEERVESIQDFLLNLRDVLIDAQKIIPGLEIIPSDVLKLKEELEFYKREYEKYKKSEEILEQEVKGVLNDPAVKHWIKQAKSMLSDLLSRPGAMPTILKSAISMDPEYEFLPEELETGMTPETNRKNLKILANKRILLETSKKGRTAFRNWFKEWILENIRKIKPTAPDKACEIIYEQLRKFILG